jgi:hypothetical protein
MIGAPARLLALPSVSKRNGPSSGAELRPSWVTCAGVARHDRKTRQPPANDGAE